MITVYNKDGKADRVRGKVGDNLLYLCKRFEVDMEGTRILEIGALALLRLWRDWPDGYFNSIAISNT